MIARGLMSLTGPNINSDRCSHGPVWALDSHDINDLATPL